MNAVNVFQNYGDARPIADLDVPKNISKALTNLSNALLTNRTLEAQKAAMQFNLSISDGSQQLPFQMLIDQLKQNSHNGSNHLVFPKKFKSNKANKCIWIPLSAGYLSVNG